MTAGGSVDMEPAPWLRNLNSAQERAVKHPPTSLQILAGPGSGKTRVLTCRTAYLIKDLGIQPQDLVVVTFTNKASTAASEMKHRLNALLSAEEARRLVIGTFHSMAVVYLRKHGSRLQLKSNWVIADRDNQLAYAKSIMKEPGIEASFTEIHTTAPKPQGLVEQISKLKSKGISPEEAEAVADTDYKKLIAALYRMYAELLKNDNALDFDDLLLYVERLFTRFPDTIANVQHILIDEFQDTNVVQYGIMKVLAKNGAVSIVGDPDQGIYGWRSAEVGNLAKMTSDFKGTTQILLEENYRSSSAILKASLAVVEQDKERIAKSLFTSHPDVTLPVLRPFEKPADEAAYIAQEVKRLVAHTGGQLNYNDFAVLLRFNALSRSVEVALTNAGIPCRMVGGSKFFDRVEVKDMLAYLQLADNPSFGPAFDRIVNVPKRGIGKVGLDGIRAAAKKGKISMFDVCAKALDGTSIGDIKPAQKRKLKDFVGVVRKVRKMAREGKSVANMIQAVVDGVGYEAHLKSTHGADTDARLENINELKTYAAQVEGIDEVSEPNAAEDQPSRRASASGASEVGSEDLDVGLSDEEPTNLRQFLASSMLSTDADTQNNEDEKNTQKVTISTCHAAKGLEWPVVFVPAVEEGTYPFYRCEEPEQVKEERRLLFVAMTRAQAFLYLSHCNARMLGAETKSRSLSSFVATLGVKKQATSTVTVSNQAAKPITNVFTQTPPSLSPLLREAVTNILHRPPVEETAVQAAIAEHSASAPPTIPIPDGSYFSRSNSWGGSGGFGGGFRAGGYASQLHGGRAYGGGGSYAAGPIGRASNGPQVARAVAPPTAHQLTTGFSSALNVHRPVASSATAQPRLTGSQSAPGAASGLTGMPETRFSKGAAPSFVGEGVPGGSASTDTAQLPNLTSFQSSSKDFMAGLKTLGMPDDVVSGPGATSSGPSRVVTNGATAAKGKKRLGAGRPAPPTKKPKT